MMTRALTALACLLAFATPAGAYIRGKTGSTPLSWPVGRNIQYQIDGSMLAGNKTSSGDYSIVPGSDPFAAAQASLDTWNAVSGSSARFSTLVAGGVLGKVDGANVIGVAQTAETISVVGSAVAVTSLYYNARTGEIVDADIILNPTLTFSTSLSLDAYDLQSILTHELGHSLGAMHSPLPSATMYPYADIESTAARTLSFDDTAFAGEAYPLAGPETGRVSGHISCPSGTCLPAPSVLLFEPSTGALIQTLGNTSGDYAFPRVPRGTYYLLAEPYVPPVLSTTDVNTSWGPGVYGGPKAPQTVEVASGSDVTVGWTPPDPVALVTASFVGDEFFGSRVHSGYATTLEMLLHGENLGDFNDEDVLVLGSGVKLQSGSINSFGTLPYRLVYLDLDVPSTASRSAAIVGLRRGDAFLFASGIAIMPDVPAVSPSRIYNAASLDSGAIAPGELLGMGGYRLGPMNGVGSAGARAAGVHVTIGGFEAPVLYAQDGSLCVQVPYELTGRDRAVISVRNGDAVAADVFTAVTPVALGLLNAAFNQDGTVNSLQHPAPGGSTVSFFATGQGLPDPLLATGEAGSYETRSTLAGVSAELGGAPVPVTAYLAPGAIGLLRIDVSVPQGISPGRVSFKFSMKDASVVVRDALVVR